MRGANAIWSLTRIGVDKMWENVIGRHIIRCNRNLLLVNAGVLTALLLWAGVSERYLYNCFNGPFHTTHNALINITNPDNLRRYFVSIDQLEPLETGLQDIETTKNKSTQEVKSRKVTATYFAAPLTESRVLLIKSPTSTSSSAYQGSLIAVPNDVRVYFQRELLDPKKRQFDDVFFVSCRCGEL